MVFVYILFIAYILAINFYAFTLVKSLKAKETGEESDKRFDGKLALTGALGGAIAIYVCMFVFKYRQSNLFLMILMPLLAVLNVFVFFSLFRFRFFVF
jgi:uncharacterized membrane protein YsdA (DUF1294 family)